LSKIAQKAVSV